MSDAALDPVRVQDYLRSRFNPIAGLTPERLALALDQFKRGYFRDLAWIMETIEERDDTVAAVAPKRKKAPSRYGWEILTLDDSAKAQRHKEALEFFYNQLSATNAIEQDERGDFTLLLQQMMDAVGMRYAVHEIVWEPRGNDLSATFWRVPLAFFEGTTGRLRFLRSVNSIYGEDMPEENWLVSVGQGVGVAAAVAYMFKQLPLKDWLIYSGRHGMPGIEGVTDSAPGSAEWAQMKAVVAMAGREMAWVRSSSQQVNKVDFGAEGELPYPALVDRMDRALSRLYRGVDLSTISSSQGEGRGASLQEDEGEILEQDDAAWLSRTLVKVSRQVLEWHFGAGVAPLAYVKVLERPKPQNVDSDLKIDAFLLKSGVELSKDYAREKYNRPKPDAADELMGSAEPAAQVPGQDPVPGQTPLMPGRNDRLEPAAFLDFLRASRNTEQTIGDQLAQAATNEVAQVMAEALAPMRERLRQIAAINDDLERMDALRSLRAELPKILRAMKVRPVAAAIERSLQTAFLNGAAESAFHRTP